MNNLRKRLIFLFCSTLIIFIGILVFELYTSKKIEQPTLGYTQEMLDYAAFNNSLEILVPSAENRALKEDTFGVAIPIEKRIYLSVPQNIDEHHIVYYYLDLDGNYLAREDHDFSTGNIMVGDTEIVLIKSNLPQLYLTIDEQYASFDELNASEWPKDTTCYGDMHLVSPAKPGEPEGWTEEIISTENDLDTPHTMSLTGRGHDSWSFRLKKPYTLGLEKAKDLLNLGKNKRWNLLADSQDRSLLKNKMLLQLSKDVGLSFTPNTESVVLYVNHRYQGVYLLTTKVSVDKNRVNLNRDDFFFNWGAIEPVQPMFLESTSWFTDGDIDQPYADLLYPENDPDIESKRQIMQQFISAIENGSDDELTDIVDLDSMARYYWIQEVSMNIDAWSRSVYGYYKADTGKIYMGPIWDMDITLGRNVLEKEGMSFMEPDGWRVRNAGWYVPLFEHPAFREKVMEVYYQGGVREALFDLVDKFEAEKEFMAYDGQLNFSYWADENISTVLSESGLYEQHTDNIISFYKNRIEWIDTQMQQESNLVEGDLCGNEKN